MKSLTDLWFSAFLKLKGYPLVTFEMISPKKAKFSFEITDEQYKLERIEFFKSDFSKFKQIMEELKDLVF